MLTLPPAGYVWMIYSVCGLVEPCYKLFLFRHVLIHVYVLLVKTMSFVVCGN